ncbi:MAG: hypothetical protein JSV33_14690 [bacterium]|nr:MAG: hypothetical protein JSV33_14690 [bacterium]
MTKLYRVSLFIVLLLVATGSLSAADRVLLFRFKGVGVDEELIDAVMLVFQGALEQEGKYIPVNAFDVVGYTDCSDVSCTAALAREAGYARAITGTLTRLGYKLIIMVQLVDAGSESIIFSDDGVSLDEEDLDIVLKRLAIGLSEGRKIESTAEIGLITEEEAEEPRRRSSYSSRSLRAGFMWTANGSMGGDIRLIVLDLAYQHDTRDFFLSGRSGIRWGGSMNEDGGSAIDIALLDAKIGRYFSRGDFAPFLSAGVGVHWIRAKERIVEINGDILVNDRADSGMGLALIAGGGITVFRTYNFQFQLDAEYIYVLEDLAVGGNPQGFMFTFCIKQSKRYD